MQVKRSTILSLVTVIVLLLGATALAAGPAQEETLPTVDLAGSRGIRARTRPMPHPV